MFRLLPFFIILLLAACEPNRPAPTPTESPPPSVTATAIPETGLKTAWGMANELASARSFETPALAISGETAVLAAFETLNGTPSLVTYLDNTRVETGLGASQPFSLTLHASGDNGTVALWLDTDESGIQKLYSAWLSADGLAPYGLVAVSANPVTRYTAATLPDKTIWVVWSTPVTGESALIGSRIDMAGRPRQPQPLRIAADFPALAVTQSGNALLYWLDGTQRGLYRGEVTDAGLTRISEISATPVTYAATDQLLRLDAGIDTTHAYLFWQILNSDGQRTIWILAAPIDGTNQTPATRLAISASETPAQTDFNHGTAYETYPDSAGIQARAVMPNSGQNETLPVTALTDDGLGVIYFRAGAPFAAQTLVRENIALVAPPALVTTDSRDLILAWWHAVTPQQAQLYSIGSRQ